MTRPIEIPCIEKKAVTGLQDTPEGKFFKVDEIPLTIFFDMIKNYEAFFKNKAWALVKKKINKNRKIRSESQITKGE